MPLKDNHVIDGNLLVKGRLYVEEVDEEKTQESTQLDNHSIELYELTLAQDGATLTSTKTFVNKHIHVLVEYETTGVHFGGSCDLHPYNGSICLCYYNIAGEMLTAYIDEEGHVVLSIPSGVTPTVIEAHYFEYK